MTRPIARSARLLLLAGLVACGASTGPTAAPAGTWTLRSIAGEPLPAAVPGALSPDNKVAHATLRLDANGTFTMDELLERDATGGGAPTSMTVTDTGTWRASGDRVTLTFPSAVVQPAVESGNTLTVTVSTRVVHAWVWEK